eukprot:g10206.t1
MPDSSRQSSQGANATATSLTLLQRLKANDGDAWDRLNELYTPLIRYWCGRQGLSPDDAGDVMQEVFQGVMKNLADFRKERPGDTFRGWLRTVTRNHVRMHFRRAGRYTPPIGGTDAHRALQDIPDTSDSESDDDPPEQIRELYNRAVELIRSEFEDRTWQAFRQVVIDGRRPADVEFDIPASDSGHVYYQDDGIAGQVSRSLIANTTEADDANIADIDPDWAHSWFTIKPASEFVISHTIEINGFTQPGAAANTNVFDSGQGLNTVLRIEIDAGNTASAAHGLYVDQGVGSTIRGLVINGVKSTKASVYADGDAGSPTIAGNFLGTDVSGTIALGGVSAGVTLHQQGFTGGSIGGNDAADRNLIAGGRYGVSLRETHGVGIQGNLIGTDRSGTAVVGLERGVTLFAVNDTVIGGVDSDVGNVISTGAGFGIYVSNSGSERTRIQGNLFGTDVSGTQPLGNGIGISERGSGTIIGGGDADDGQLDGIVAARNIFAASTGVGIDLLAIQTGATVMGNYVGTDVTGTVALGNTRGIRLGHSSAGTVENQVGGPGAGEGNLVSGNTYGVWIQHQSTRDNTLQGNWIGLAADGSPLGNTADGIFYRPAYFTSVATPDVNTIGGTAPGEGNIIAHNTRSGIRVDSNGSPSQHPRATLSILGNSIYENGELGIDLLERDAVNSPLAGVTPNDANDADDGPNYTQNHPVLTTVTASGGSTHVEGTLNSTPATTFRIEFFANSQSDPSGFGEGEVYLGFADVTTDADGDAALAVDLPGEVAAGHVVTATATAPNGATSEFSGQRVATEPALPDLEVVSFTAPAEAFLDQDISDQLTVRIRNSGLVQTPSTGLRANFYISMDETITADDRLLVSNAFAVGPLSAGAEADVIFLADTMISSIAPDDMPITGEVFIGVIVEGAIPFDEVDAMNNTGPALPIVVRQGLPDLEIVSITAPAEAILDQPLGSELTVTIRNNGTAALAADTILRQHVEFYVSTDSTITTADRQLINQTGNGVIDLGCLGDPNGCLPPGEVKELTFSFPSVPSSIPDSNPPLGDVFIGAIIDKDGVIEELDESNNVSVAVPITVREFLPDLEIVSITAPTQAILDQSLGSELTVTVRNNGTAPLPFGQSLRQLIDFYVSTDEVITTADRRLINQTTGGQIEICHAIAGGCLQPGEEKELTYVFQSVPSTIPDSNPPLGDVFIGAIIDKDGVIEELDETNNTSTAVPINVSEFLPDLEIVSITAPAEAILDHGLGTELTVTVRNNGSAPLSLDQSLRELINIYVSTDETITADDRELVIPSSNSGFAGFVELCGGSISCLPAGAVTTLTFYPFSVSSTIPDSNPPLGDVFIGAIIDKDGIVEELDETNNTSVALPINVCVGDLIIDASTDQSFLDSITYVCGSVIVDGVAGLTTLSLPNLGTIEGDLIVTNNPDLVEMIVPLLTEIGGSVELSSNPLLEGIVGASDNDNAGMIDLGQLEAVGGDVMVSGNDIAGAIDLGGLQSVGDSVVLTGNASATVISLNQLQAVGGHLIVDGNADPAVEFSDGTTTVAGDATFGDVFIEFDNATLEVSGTLTLGEDATFAIDPDSIVSADLAQLQQGSTVQGNGTVAAGSTVSSGAVLPGSSPGTLTIDGDFEQGPEGVTLIEIGGPTPITEYDVFHITGNATFSGIVQLVLIDGYAPQPGETFEPLGVDGTLDLTAATFILPNGLHLFGHTIVATPEDGVLLVDDPEHPGQSILIVGGTSGNDQIDFKWRRRGEEIEVRLNRERYGRYATGELSRLVAFGKNGNDHIRVSNRISIPSELYGDDGRDHLRAGAGAAMLFGGEGNDRLHAGREGDILVGGSGNDFLTGGSGRDLIIGGDGRDLLFGGFGEDLIITGSTVYDSNPSALRQIHNEWNSNRDYESRVKNIRGEDNATFADRKNGSYSLKNDGDDATVFDDGDLDIVFGGFGRDWFFADEGGFPWGDWLLGRRNGEFVERAN